LPSAHLEQAAAAKVYESTKIPRDTMAERVEHVVKSSFNGRRIVIFSGGAMNTDRAALLDEARAIKAGGGFGSIMGRNVFQRPRDEAIKLLNDVMSIYEGK
jgi:fructose-bisphosphate aldolase, class I